MTDTENYGSEMTDEGPRKMDRARYLAFIQEGLDSLDRGEGVPHEVVMTEMRARMAKHRAA
jgi:predicted transcriptional regulator